MYVAKGVWKSKTFPTIESGPSSHSIPQVGQHVNHKNIMQSTNPDTSEVRSSKEVSDGVQDEDGSYPLMDDEEERNLLPGQEWNKEDHVLKNNVRF